MPNLPLGLFRTLKPVTAKDYLVAQVSTGTTYFNYLKLGTNSTETEGKNIVFGNSMSLKTVNWTAPDGRIVSTLYKYGRRTSADLTPAPSISPYVNSYELSIYAPTQPPVLVDGRLVARLPELAQSPAHIENVGGTDYLVSYLIVGLSVGFRVVKHKAVLNMNADQTNPPVLAVDSQIDYTTTGAENAFTAASYVINPFGDTTNSDSQQTESKDYLHMHERNLVTNADGTKTILFAMKKYGSLWNAFPIYELTDNGGLSIVEIGEFTNVYTSGTIPITDTESNSGSDDVVSDLSMDVATCTDQTSGETIICAGQHTGSMSGTRTSDQGELRSKYFLGCAYDRKTDQPIILQLHTGQRALSYTLNVASSFSGTIDYTKATEQPSVITQNSIAQNTTHSTSSDGAEGSPLAQTSIKRQLFELIISDVSEAQNNTILELNSGNSLTVNGSRNVTEAYRDGWVDPLNAGTNGYKDYSYTFNLNYKEIDNFNIINLAHNAIVYKEYSIENQTQVKTKSGLVVKSDAYYYIDDIVSDPIWEAYDKIKVIVDGVETQLSTARRDTTDFYVRSYAFDYNYTTTETYDPFCTPVCPADGPCQQTTKTITNAYA